LCNFDVLNDTGDNCHGFEIELKGVSCNQVLYTYPNSRYGHPDKVSFVGGCIIRYSSKCNTATNTWSAYTVPATTNFHPTGHQCTSVANNGCEHFGVSLPGINPTKTTYRWLCADPLKVCEYKVIIRCFITSITWQVTLVNGQIILRAVFVAPCDIRIECSIYGFAFWVKVFWREFRDPRVLEELVSGNCEVVPSDTSDDEFSWLLVQAEPTCANGTPLPGVDNEIVLEKVLGQGSNSMVRRYELYNYIGAYDQGTHKAVPINPVLPDPNDLGSYIGAQMAAVNLMQVVDGAKCNNPCPNGDSDCWGATDGCTKCKNNQCVKPDIGDYCDAVSTCKGADRAKHCQSNQCKTQYIGVNGEVCGGKKNILYLY
jgi:hypothetical protein